MAELDPELLKKLAAFSAFLGETKVPEADTIAGKTIDKTLKDDPTLAIQRDFSGQVIMSLDRLLILKGRTETSDKRRLQKTKNEFWEEFDKISDRRKGKIIPDVSDYLDSLGKIMSSDSLSVVKTKVDKLQHKIDEANRQLQSINREIPVWDVMGMMEKIKSDILVSIEKI